MNTVLRVAASPGQRRLWAIEQTSAGEPLHNLNMELLFDPPTDPDVLRAALADVIARHEALRTRFEVVDGVLYQCVLAEGATVAVPFVDLTGLPADEAAARHRRERQELAGRSFDLAAAPLLRLCQIRLPDPAARNGVHDILLFVVHHIIVDAWSCQIVLTDLRRALTARAAGVAPDWVPVPVQFADYAAWRASQADDPDAVADLDYWRTQLADVAQLDLTLGRPYPAEPSYQAGSAELDLLLGKEITAGVDRLAAGQRATRFAVLLAAWSAALSRVFGGADIAVGTSVANRDLPEIAQTVGFIVDRLVLRVSLAGAPTFRTLIARAREVVLGAYEHNRVGFDQVVDAVAPPRRYGIAPLAQASINLQPRINVGAGAEMGGGQFGNGTARHDIGLDFADHGGYLIGMFQYRHDVVPTEAARRVRELFIDILTRCAADPAAADMPAGELTALSAAEIATLHAEQFGGPLNGGGGTFRDLVDHWVRTTPDAVAVTAPGQRLTYAALGAMADQLAGRLTDAGVRPGDAVLVGVGRTVELPVAVLGSQAAGAVPVPVDAASPAEHLAAVVAATGARVALLAPGTEATLPAGVAVLPITVANLADATPATPISVRPDAPAYVLFTSGSTGRPKGVVVEQRQLVAYILGVRELLDPLPGEVHLLVQAPTVDSSWTTVAGALASGGVLRMVDEDVARDPVELAAQLTGSPVDYLKITPSHLAALLSGIDPETLRPRRAVILGGESEQRTAVDRLRVMGWRVFGHYGPTETTVGVLAHELTTTTGAGSSTVPLGRPLRGVRVYLLDDELRPVPPGCQGELFIGGTHVARGYANAPGQTAAVCLPDPFAPEPGSRMYRTGDLARRLPDGTFEFGGRRDRQVKIRGNRLELAGIETALVALPQVARAAVVVRGVSLVGYVVPTPGATPTPAELTAAVASVLPAFAVPGAFVVLDELPMTAGGKLATADLPEPDADTTATGAAPVGTAQRKLAEVWQKVLRRDDIPVTARFFDVGGDSIRAIELVGEARAAGIPLSGRILFNHQTIEAIAAHLAEHHSWPRDSEPDQGSPVVVWLPGAPHVDSPVSAGLAAEPAANGVRLTVPPARLPDLAALRIEPDSGVEPPPFADGVAVAVLPADTSAALAGPAHDAYGTDFTELVTAAAELSVVDGDPATVIAAVKAALRAPGGSSTNLPELRVIDQHGCRVLDPGGSIAVTRAEIVASGPDAETQVATLSAALVDLVAHCVTRGPVYSAGDFPDAGLDDSALAQLLDRLDGSPA